MNKKQKSYIDIKYWSNGNKFYEVPYLNYLRHGLSKFWYDDGSIDSQTSYKQYKRHGIRIVFEFDKWQKIKR